MNLIPLPAFQDDTLWLLHDGKRAPVADPGDARPVRDFLARTGLQLDAILVTHPPPGHIVRLDASRARRSNPFLRTRKPGIMEAAPAHAMRPWNNEFR
jgi:glyoxylase-like metal-dependent hydrolase (beta-lactamase superfamily II)